MAGMISGDADGCTLQFDCHKGQVFTRLTVQNMPVDVGVGSFG
jgi:hypothetical protein